MTSRAERRHGRLALTLLLGLVASAHADWLQWGGPTCDFHVRTKGLSDTWPQFGPKWIWRRELGDGYSAILAQGDRLFTMYRPGDEEAVVCLDAKTGKTVWEHRYKPGEFYKDLYPKFGRGPNATPLIVGDCLVAIGITGLIHCLDVKTGKVRWKKDLSAEFGRMKRKEEYGFSQSPVRNGETVVVAVGGEKHAVVAFHPLDGAVAWRSGPHDGVSYAAPAVLRLAGRDQVVFMSPTTVVGLDAADGKALWDHPCKNIHENNCTTPIQCGDNLLWVATQKDGGARLLELTRAGVGVKVKEVWNKPDVRVFHWNVVKIGDHMYGSFGNSSASLLGVVNWKTGEFAWKQRGLSAATCLHADGKLIFLDANGQIALAKPSPQGIEIVESVQLADRVAWTAPTLVGTTLYVRDRKHVWALDLAAKK